MVGGHYSLRQMVLAAGDVRGARAVPGCRAVNLSKSRVRHSRPELVCPPLTAPGRSHAASLRPRPADLRDCRYKK